MAGGGGGARSRKPELSPPVVEEGYASVSRVGLLAADAARRATKSLLFAHRAILRERARLCCTEPARPPYCGCALEKPMPAAAMLTRPIPATGEALPVIGCGTYMGFDQAPGSAGFAALPGVLSALFAAGGSVVDSSPMYGKAEAAAGQVLAEAGSRDRAFVATKVWTTGRAAGIRQMEESLRLLRTARVDLMQVHNLVD
jgi:hypothetical protein